MKGIKTKLLDSSDLKSITQVYPSKAIKLQEKDWLHRFWSLNENFIFSKRDYVTHLASEKVNRQIEISQFPFNFMHSEPFKREDSNASKHQRRVSSILENLLLLLDYLHSNYAYIWIEASLKMPTSTFLCFVQTWAG